MGFGATKPLHGLQFFPATALKLIASKCDRLNKLILCCNVKNHSCLSKVKGREIDGKTKRLLFDSKNIP